MYRVVVGEGEWGRSRGADVPVIPSLNDAAHHRGLEALVLALAFALLDVTEISKVFSASLLPRKCNW